MRTYPIPEPRRVAAGALMPTMARGSRGKTACIAGLALGVALAASPAKVRAQTGTVDVAVDATAAGSPLERVWPYHGFDEVNYATTPDGKALLAELAAAHTAPVHVRTHFLLNTGNGTPSLKCC